MKCLVSKCALIFVVLGFAIAAWPATTYSNLDDSTLVDNGVVGWGSCVPCAGGSSTNASIASSPFQSSPSVGGDSRDFYINGAAYSDALWWYKVGPNNAASNFKFDFWLNTDSTTQSAQALEFDTYQFISGREYMFGTQCDYASATWDVWNAGTLQWTHTAVPCTKFTPHLWYHVILAFHRTADTKEHYDTLTIIHYNSNGAYSGTTNYTFNKTFPSQLTPPGWGDDLGVQFQMDIGAKGTQMQEWVDLVSLTAW